MCGSSLSPFNIHDNDRVGILTGDITTVHQSCYASLRYNTCCNIKVMMLIQVCVYEKIYNDWTFNLDSYINSIPSLWNNNNNNNTNQWESLSQNLVWQPLVWWSLKTGMRCWCCSLPMGLSWETGQSLTGHLCVDLSSDTGGFYIQVDLVLLVQTQVAVTH